MSSAKTVVFLRPLKKVSVEYAGDEPLGGKDQQDAIAEAYQRGVQEASAKFNEQLLEMRQQLQSHAEGILSDIQKAYDDMAAQVSLALPEVVLGSVYRLVGPSTFDQKELKAKVEHLIAESCPAQEPVDVFLSAGEYEKLSEIYEGFTTSQPRLSFKVDAELKDGDCRMVSKFGEVDATLKTQLKRLMDELLTA